MHRRIPILLLAFSASTPLGCSDLLGQTGTVKLVPVATAASTAASATTSSASASSNQLSQVRILIAEASFATSGDGDAGAPSGAAHGPGSPPGIMPGGCQGMDGGEATASASLPATRLGPVVMTLSASALAGGSGTPVVFQGVPADTYPKTQLKIAPLAAGAASDAALSDFESSGASVLIDGTWSGSPYTFAADIEVSVDRAVELVVGSGSEASLQWGVDTSTWFTAADGTVLNPTLPSNHGAIAANIQSSLAQSNGP